MKHLPSKTWNGIVIVEILPKEEETTASGLIIPEMANTELREGKVLVVSEDTKDVFNVGDTVIFPPTAGNGSLVGGVECVWIHASKIWATV